MKLPHGFPMPDGVNTVPHSSIGGVLSLTRGRVYVNLECEAFGGEMEFDELTVDDALELVADYWRQWAELERAGLR